MPLSSVPINLSALSTIPTTVTSLNGLILATPQALIGYQPQPTPSISGAPTDFTDDAFIFDYEGEQSLSLEADITDHFIEDNTSIQDHIALKPVRITTHGFIGE